MDISSFFIPIFERESWSSGLKQAQIPDETRYENAFNAFTLIEKRVQRSGGVRKLSQPFHNLEIRVIVLSLGKVTKNRYRGDALEYERADYSLHGPDHIYCICR